MGGGLESRTSDVLRVIKDLQSTQLGVWDFASERSYLTHPLAACLYQCRIELEIGHIDGILEQASFQIVGVSGRNVEAT